LRDEGIARLKKRLLDASLDASASQIQKLDGEVGLRAWESQSAGLSFDLEGPDAQAVTMPPAPGLTNRPYELAAEMAEVYAQALLRDVPFEYFANNSQCKGLKVPQEFADKLGPVFDALNNLNRKPRFNGFDNRILAFPTHDEAQKAAEPKTKAAAQIGAIEFQYQKHRPSVVCGDGAELSPGNLFRGITRGDLAGPYLSQFMLIGNQGVNGLDRVSEVQNGKVTYGGLQVDQRVRFAHPGVDFMTTWEEWYSVQCAADVGNVELFADQINMSKDAYRFIATPRDLSTYVHYDALYEAYLNACLILLGRGNAFDPGIPFQAANDRDHQQGFAHFGGPHILSLVTEVATRALKCVRFQKFNVHRRLRPEALAARLEKEDAIGIGILSDVQELLEDCGLLSLVRAHNLANNGDTGEANVLLPMAFTEGSPMHPTYGAGHATVAGACVAVLKAFFDGDQEFEDVYVSRIEDENTGRSRLETVACSERLTVEGELNKLAANISIGRDWAGVHYYSDYVESLRMGEKIAIGILQEQKMMFHEPFHMSFTSFDGVPVSI
jgi:hypothetical protein